MATVNPQPVKNVSSDGSVFLVQWLALTTTNADGLPIGGLEGALSVPRLSDKTVQISGTFGIGGSLTLQGSNDGTNWFPLTDPQGNAITKTAAALETVTENPVFIRPFITAGDGSTDLNVYLVCVLNNNLRT